METQKPLLLNADNFEEIIGGETPVLVDFFAVWCGPCKMLSPLVEELAAEKAGKLLVAKLNIDEAPEIADRFGVVAVPTLLLFKDGQAAEKLVGYREKEELEAFLDEFL